MRGRPRVILWGDKEAACKKVGLKFNTAYNCGYVASKYQFSARAEILSFKHHRMLVHADLPGIDRRRLLSRAKKGDDGKVWSSARLKKERDIILGIAPPASTGGFDNGVDALEESVVASLPKNTGPRTVKAVISGLRKEATKLKHEFSSAVEKEAEVKAKVRRENMIAAQKRADEQYEKAVKMAAGVKAYMTRAEFQLIRSCLHPDRNTHPKAAKAFDIFNRLTDVKDW